MGLELMIVTILPLLIYAFVESKWGMRAGVMAGMVLATFVVAWMLWRLGSWDYLTIFDLSLIYLLGGTSLYFKDSRLFRYQPAAIGIITSIYIFILQYLGTPFLEHAQELGAKLGGQSIVSSHWLSVASLHFGCLFFLHGCLMAYLAKNASLKMWVYGRLAIYPLFLGLFLLDAFLVDGGIVRL